MKAEVYLAEWTPCPERQVYRAYCMSTDGAAVGGAYQKHVHSSEIERVFAYMRESHLLSPLEFVHTVWVFKGVSRAFTHQLVRYRLASFAQASTRVKDAGNFADDEDYYLPESIDESTAAEIIVHMREVQELYRKISQQGRGLWSKEVARSVLPTSYLTDIMMAANFRVVLNLCEQRLCVRASDEIRGVAQQMRSEVAGKMGYRFAELLAPGCVRARRCIMPEVYCGMPIWDMEQAERDKVVSSWQNSKVGKETRLEREAKEKMA